MPRFLYKARTYTVRSKPSESIEGVLEADSTVAASRQLARMGYFPTLIREEAARKPFNLGRLRQNRIPLAEMSGMFRQISDLMGAGLSLMSALSMAAEQAAHSVLKTVLQDQAKNVREGRSLSWTMERHPQHFKAFHVRLVYAGETSGSLDRALERLADLTEKEDDIRSQIQAAAAYPLFIVAVGAATIIFLLIFVVPRMAAMFADFRQTLPLPTRMLLGFSGLAQRFGWLAIPGAAALASFVHQPRTQARVKAKIDAMLIRLPVIKSWIVRREMASYARTLGSLLNGGVPVLQSLSVALGTVQNSAIRKEFESLEPKVREGRPLAKCFREIPIIPAAFCNLAAVGEEGGRLGGTLLKIAESYERQSQRELKTVVSLLEPLLILVVGAILGAIVISIMLPIFEINSLIR